MNKKVGFLITGFLILSFLINFVSAYGSYGYIDLRQGSEQIVRWVEDFGAPLFSALLGGEYGGANDGFLFERFLLFILLLSIIYVSIKEVPIFKDNKPVIMIISFVIPLIAIRYMDFNWLMTVLIQYAVLGIAITAILPFLIYLLFLHGWSNSATVRKIGWIFFVVVYFGMWATATTEFYGEIYMWTMVIALIFLFLDGTIHSYYLMQQMKAGGSRDKWDHILKLQQQLRDWQYQSTGMPQKVIDRRTKELQDEIKRFQKMISVS